MFAQDKNEYVKAIPNDIEIIDSTKSLCTPNDYRFVAYQTGGCERLCISRVTFFKDGEKKSFTDP